MDADKHTLSIYYVCVCVCVRVCVYMYTKIGGFLDENMQMYVYKCLNNKHTLDLLWIFISTSRDLSIYITQKECVFICVQ